MKFIVNVSGGLTSYEALRRTLDKHGPYNTVAIFADTGIEDEDLYRFLKDVESYLGIHIGWLADGRTPFEVMRDRRVITMQGMAPCSIELKRDVIDEHVKEFFSHAEYTRVFGMDWTEQSRMERLRKRLAPVPVWFPLSEPPYANKEQIMAQLRSVGIEPPRLYAMGFKHNNCGGGCVKAGQAQWAHLFKLMPERYARWEAEEEGIRQYLGKDISILKDRRNNESKPLTLRAFREGLQASQQYDLMDWGACSCYVQEPTPPGRDSA